MSEASTPGLPDGITSECFPSAACDCAEIALCDLRSNSLRFGTSGPSKIVAHGSSKLDYFPSERRFILPITGASESDGFIREPAQDVRR